MHTFLQFPIKGSFYYSSNLAYDLDLLKPMTRLVLKAEPDNVYDLFARQVWLPTPLKPAQQIQQNNENTEGYLLGYIPKVMTARLDELLKTHEIKSLKLHSCTRHGQYIELIATLELELSLMNFITLKFLALWSLEIAKFKTLRRRLFRK